LRDNFGMLTICKGLGFRLRMMDDPAAITAFLDL